MIYPSIAKLNKRRWTEDHVSPKTTRYRSKYFPPTVDPKSIDWLDFAFEYDEAQKEMEENHTWFEDGHNYYFRRAELKNIALGRTQFYVEFVDRFYEKYGRRLYLLDYMLRLEKAENPGASLLYFIDDADEIHVNLEGVKTLELYQAAVGLGRSAGDKNDIGAPHTSSWEINQIFQRGLVSISWFYVAEGMTRLEAWIAMGGKVPMKRILQLSRRKK